MIPDSFVQDLLARVDVVDVVGKYVQLRKGGANLLGLCPFHNEKSPSFTVSPTKQFYHCFGCGAHGTAITFLIEHTGASFPEAVRSLAANVGMVVPEEQRSPQQQVRAREQKAEVNRHQQVLEKAQARYLALLRESQDAIAYLKQRGITGKTAKLFGLGWSGHDRSGLKQVFDHYDDPLLTEAGLVIESEDGRRYDRFRERIMFPIINAKGNLIGFGGRIIGKGEPKYLNSPETPVFNKGQELYGLWENRQGIRQEGCVLVVEGYMDVVGLAQQGIGFAVATLGTATTPTHIQKLLRTSDRIVFSFDGDGAGRRAAWKALNVCLPFLRDDISLRFLFLPNEHDPDSFVRDLGPEAFRKELAQSRVLSTFLLEELASRHNLNEAEGRAACLHEARPLISAIPASGIRTQIENDFAKLVSLTSAELLTDLARFEEAAQKRQEWQKSLPDAPAKNQGAAQDSASFGSPFGSPFDTAPASFEPKPSARFGRAGTRRGGRQVTPLARRLIKLLASNLELVHKITDQQLEVLGFSPQFAYVREFIAFAQTTQATHLAALIQRAEPGSEIANMLTGLTIDSFDEDALPDPAAEWNDALRKIEFERLNQDKENLVAGGLKTAADRERYKAINARIRLLK